jgi:ABC-type lipoprotein release transport system permease subunit
MGVRIALGASRAAMLGVVVRQGALPALIGIIAGLAGAYGVTRVIRSLLYNVTPIDRLSFAGVTLFLVPIAVLASNLPTRRATNVDPIFALRNE